MVGTLSLAWLVVTWCFPAMCLCISCELQGEPEGRGQGSLATCCKITLAKKVLSHELGRHHTPHLSSPFHLATVFLGCAFFPTSSSFLNHQQPEFCPQQLSSNCSLLTKSKRSGPVSPLLAHLQLLAPTTHLLTYNTLHSQLINVVSSTPHSP